MRDGGGASESRTDTDCRVSGGRDGEVGRVSEAEQRRGGREVEAESRGVGGFYPSSSTLPGYNEPLPTEDTAIKEPTLTPVHSMI